MLRVTAIIAMAFLALGCGNDDELTVLEPSENVPIISIVNDGLLSDGRTHKTFGYHLQSDAILEHDIIVHLRISDTGDDNIVREDDKLFLMSADNFRSELFEATDSYVTESEIRRRNQAYGEKGWWGTGPVEGFTVDQHGNLNSNPSLSEFYPPVDLWLGR